MKIVKDLIEKLSILPPDMPLELLMIGVHAIEDRIVVSYGTSPDNVNVIWLKDITPDMKDSIAEIHKLACERIKARNKIIEISERLK